MDEAEYSHNRGEKGGRQSDGKKGAPEVVERHFGEVGA